MNKNIIFQNLEDAGCNALIIEEFFKFYAVNNHKEILKILNNHKKELLNNLHAAQKQIDCLDFLIFSLKQKNI